MANLIHQNTTFNPSYGLEEQVKAFEKEGGHFKLFTNKGTYFSRAIIITCGVGAFAPRKLDHEKAAQFENQSLHYFLKIWSHLEIKKWLY